MLFPLAALGAALGGFYALSLAMDRHYEDSFGRGASPGRARRWLQAAGTLALLLSMVLCCRLKGGGQGTVLWCGLLTVAALLVCLTLSYAPRHAMRLMFGAGGLTLLALVAGTV
ncbi:DUF3325 family protein [Xylophilus sp. Kf1]|nr:DUF3325 family protein [Xylophilus sp. Kf1]